MMLVSPKLRLFGLAALLAGGAGFLASGARGDAAAQESGKAPAPNPIVAARGGFIENLGQYPGDVRYKLTNNGVDVWLRDASMLYVTSDAAPGEVGALPDGPVSEDVPDDAERVVNGYAVAVEFVDAGRAGSAEAFAPSPAEATIEASNPLGGELNWLMDGDAVTGVRAYGAVTYREVWPGIDLVLVPTARGADPVEDASPSTARDDTVLKAVWTVAPGADVGAIRLRYAGADRVRIDETGNLVVETPVGDLVESAPFVYQQHGDARQVVPSSFTLDAPGRMVGFQVGQYDQALPLIIDPSVQWSRQISGTSGDFGSNVHMDATGLYYTGMTQSTNYPTTAGAFQTDQASNDCFATKTDATNNTLIWSTYIGGTGVEYSCQSVLEAAGTLVIAFGSSGTTPGTPTVIGTVGGTDLSVVRLNSTGTALLNSVEAGGTSTDYGHGIAQLANGSFAVTGSTSSTTGWPALGGAQPTSAGSTDAYVFVLNNAMNAALGFSYMGDASVDAGNSVAGDSASNIYVHYTTLVSSNPKPLIAGPGGNYDLAVAKLNPTATSFAYHGRIGGTSTDPTAGTSDTTAPQNFYHGADEMIVVDGLGQAWVTGMTASTNWPTTPGAFDTTHGGSYDVFVTGINASGTGLVASTFLGGTSTDTGRGIRIGPDGNLYVAGSSISTNYPTTGGEVQTTNAGSYDYIRSILTPDVATLLCSTYWGGSSADYGAALIVPAQYQTIQTGATLSANFPTVPAGSPILGTTGSYNVGNVRLNCGGASLEIEGIEFINLGPRLRPLVQPSPVTPFAVEPAPATEAEAGELPYAENVPFQRPAGLYEECLAPGNYVEVAVTIANTGLTDQLGAGPEYSGSWNGSLFAGQPGSCEFFVGAGTCEVTLGAVKVNADIPAGGQIQFAWIGRLVGGLPSGTVIEIASTLLYDTDDNGINDAVVGADPLELILDCAPMMVDPNRPPAPAAPAPGR